MVNRVALWQVLRMYDWGRVKLLSGIKIFWMCFGLISTDGGEISRKLTSGTWVECAIRSLVNARDLELECV